jgi:hypothetical protein
MWASLGGELRNWITTSDIDLNPVVVVTLQDSCDVKASAHDV